MPESDNDMLFRLRTSGIEDTMFAAVCRRVAEAKYARVVTGGGFRAADRPVAGARADADVRVLLVGTGLTSGWGVATHQLALTGLLRDELQHRSRREVRVELVGDELLDVRTAAVWVGDRARDGWDAVVVAVGANDAARLTPLAVWEREYRTLVGTMRADLPPEVPLVLAELPPMSSIVPLRGVATRFVAAHAQRMNEVVQRIAHETASTVCVPLPAKATEAGRPWGSAAAYQPWAAAIATAVLESVRAAASAGNKRVRVLSATTELLMEQAYRGGNQGLQRLVDEAAETFAVDSARVKLVEGDRVFVAADSSRGPAKELPRSLTFCDVTVEQGELEVRSVAADPRFAGNPLLRLAGLTSYAGVAVKAPDGDPVGTVCVFNGAAADGVDMRALRSLARRVEAELANPADPAPPASAEEPGPVVTGPRRAGIADRLRGYAHLRVKGARFAREARQGRDVPAGQGALQVFGPDPIRVLVFGGEYAVGYGAGTRAEGLDGAIADLLHRHTGRGVVVHNRSDDRWRVHELADQLGGVGAYLYDLVVCAPLFAEAGRYTTLLPWRVGVTRLVARVGETSNAGTVLLGIPPLTGSQPIAIVARWRARQVERVFRGITERIPKALVVPVPAIDMDALASTSGPRVYADAARAALPAMLELLGIRTLHSATTADRPATSSGAPQHRPRR